MAQRLKKTRWRIQLARLQSPWHWVVRCYLASWLWWRRWGCEHSTTPLIARGACSCCEPGIGCNILTPDGLDLSSLLCYMVYFGWISFLLSLFDCIFTVGYGSCPYLNIHLKQNNHVSKKFNLFQEFFVINSYPHHIGKNKAIREREWEREREIVGVFQWYSYAINNHTA